MMVDSEGRRSTLVENPVPSIERIRVRYGETDQMGHAYYANYLYWFEQARGRWCRDRGFAYSELEAESFFLPVVEVHARYLGEVLYDDWVQIIVTLTEIRRASMRFEYQVLNERTGKISTDGYTWHVLMGGERKAVSIAGTVQERLLRNPKDCVPLD